MVYTANTAAFHGPKARTDFLETALSVMVIITTVRNRDRSCESANGENGRDEGDDEAHVVSGGGSFNVLAG
jgi:hypothetical protein